jgi:MoxR-like ATPase
VIERAYIHVTGPEGSGKTTLVEAILEAFDGPAITVRCRRDDDLDESVESASRATRSCGAIAKRAHRVRHASRFPPKKRTAMASSAARS